MATTSSTTTVNVRELTGTSAISYIRAQTLTLTANNCRPNTALNVFFDTTIVNHWCTPSGGNQGDDILSDNNGSATFTFSLQGGTFNTGVREIIVTDAPAISNINGLVFGTARANFTTAGTMQLFQTTTTSTTTNVVTIDKLLPAPAPVIQDVYDPIAQSFFTYGKVGGVCVTSVEVYFESKDATSPVRLELRNMVNGYPSSNAVTDPDQIVFLPASSVNVSSDASVATKFTFNHPVFLQQDKDYCFVVHSNSNNYYLFSAKLGETSFETGKTIFDQPYVGSMFKSSNNSTWTAAQDEDIKFNINIANFDTSSNGIIDIHSRATYFAVSSLYFSTTVGSNIITYRQPQKHGLEVSSKINIAVDANTTYNGIPAASIAGDRTVTNVIDEYTIQFLATTSGNVASNALSTGPMSTGGSVKLIQVTNGGTGYTVPPNVQFSSLSGINASATAVIDNGTVVAIKVVGGGSGYTTPPTVIISGGNGVDATAESFIDGMFTVLTNRPVNSLIPNIPAITVGDTMISATVSATQLNYPGGNLSTYIPVGQTQTLNLNSKTYLPVNSVVASDQNETAKMSGNPSMLIQYNLRSTNPNISPVLDFRNNPSISTYSYRINNQSGEVIGESSNTELNPASGTAESRYLTRKVSLMTPSTGLQIISSIYSQAESSVDWYIRTNLSGSGVDSATLSWQLLKCNSTVNKSLIANQFIDYTFYLYGIPSFDTYELKAVMRTSNPAIVPIVNNYRVIISV